ncbi:cob(I)yrinic acid a,c-diamide adenosyltransferase [Bythopirellula polymerisocia]|uniref:Corrinoid adenosyltransferase n=1 Tax=Bythopirellula polymerisocia TaxID=2528003 RepID=A0A5C6CET3_9BACT|nr:cob(I)yrinic acid a,c-diamide adenosyltransferase [Bythopirellula polymerisocia]TWU22612.1 Cob(I)yrinic acid a,c-diamide adenosyltransferase [Bythopirellula polymerisocia]
MKIYTKTGDDGSTSLYGGIRVSKTDARIEACGAVDELNALLGVVRVNGPSPSIDPILAHLQNQLFDLGAELATPDASAKGTDYLQDSDVAQLEAWIDQLDPALPMLKTFILPGGSSAGAWLHLARSVCRRAERKLVALDQKSPLRRMVLLYVNRLGDLLFVLARTANAESGTADVPWQKSR